MRLVSLLQRSIRIWLQADGWQRGAALSFYGLFSIAPLFVLILSVFGILFEQKVVQSELYTSLLAVMGPGTASALHALIGQVSVFHGGWTGIVWNLVLTAVGASAVMNQLQAALQTIWRPGARLPEGVLRRNVKRYLRSLFALSGLGILFVLSLLTTSVLILFGPWFKQLLFGTAFPSIWSVVSSISVLVFSMLFFTIFYRVLPERACSWRMTGIAVFVATILVLLGKGVIQWVATIKSVFSLFGAGSAVVYLLVWCFYLAQAFLFGAAVAQASEEQAIATLH